jgi:tight adherence protein B
MTILLFILLLVVSFLVMLYFLRPTRTETAVQQHLENIEENRAVEGDGTTILRRQALSATPWLDELLRDLPGSAEVARLIRQAGQTWQVSSFLLLSLVVTVSVASLASLAIPSIVLSVLFGIAAGSLPYLFLLIARERRFRKCDAQVPEAVDLMARALRAGHAVPAVLEMVGKEIAEPLAGEFRIVHEEQNFGLPLRDAMLNLVDRVPRDDVRFVTTAILLQKETGRDPR